MEFNTRVNIPPANYIGYQTPLLLIGSCFADNIGEKLITYKFNAIHNPFGTIYNPVSVGHALQYILNGKLFTKSDLHLINGRWLSFSHYTRFSGSNPDEVLDNINGQIEAASSQLRNSVVVITLGTAWVYELIETGRIVANCHKLPDKLFRRYLLSVESVVETFRSILKQTENLNTPPKIIFTLSPVRHWRDGAIDNQLSKATLTVAIHRLISEFPKASYFPAYEIQMDELRDYRFYARDMLHPSDTAIDYIWERFTETFMDSDNREIMEKITTILKAASHKPLNVGSSDYKYFVIATLEKIKILEKSYPFIDFSAERKRLGIGQTFV